LRGRVRTPPDRSIAHRALVLNALANGPARIVNLPWTDDVAATAQVLAALGVSLRIDGEAVILEPPTGGLREPDDVLDCGGSLTTFRLLAGVLANCPFHAVLSGDDTLRARNLSRLLKPLRAMGARIDGRADGTLAPLAFRGGNIQLTHCDLAPGAEWVKPAVLLAGRTAGVAVREARHPRDHTERMLQRMGATLRRDTAEDWLVLLPPERLGALDVHIPGDPSEALPFALAATLVPGSELVIDPIATNPTRTAGLEVLVAMGASVDYEVVSLPGAESAGSLTVRSAELHGVTIEDDDALRVMDDLAVLGVAAAFAEGDTRICGIPDLGRDPRTATLLTALRALGVPVELRPDELAIHGSKPRAGAIDANGDARIAAAFAAAALAIPGGLRLRGVHGLEARYPTFLDELRERLA
jgi:3-phosphoshikimate 1-carboxyvinyltransferase